MSDEFNESESRYINTDLELVAPINLTPLANYFDLHASLLYCNKWDDGQWCVFVEEKESGCILNGDLNRDITGLLDVIDQFDDHLESLWNSCTKKEFNIGIDCGETQSYNVGIHKENIQRLAKLGCTISVTVYPIKDEEYEEDESE